MTREAINSEIICLQSKSPFKGPTPPYDSHSALVSSLKFIVANRGGSWVGCFS